ncbi:MAG: hypothetical protein V4631_07930 [Pseudomonadota bacterium]
MKTTGQIDRKLQEQVLLARRVEGDHLVLADAILLAALDGSRTLTAGERAALSASPLTLRRFRALSTGQRRAALPANDAWSGSAGMLRAAADGHPLGALATDDGHWALHFLEQDGAWRVILTLAATAPFAARLVREQPMLRVVDGGGAIVLQGSLDADGECESAWPFESAPAMHFHAFGARFAVEPVHT